MSDYGFGHAGANRAAMRRERVWGYRQVAHGLSAAELRLRVRDTQERLAKGFGPIADQEALVEAYSAELQARAKAMVA